MIFRVDPSFSCRDNTCGYRSHAVSLISVIALSFVSSLWMPIFVLLIFSRQSRRLHIQSLSSPCRERSAVFSATAAAGFRCEPTAVSPSAFRLCRKGACSVAMASSSTAQQSLSLSRRGLARIKVLWRSGMDRTSVCMARQSMFPPV